MKGFELTVICTVTVERLEQPRAVDTFVLQWVGTRGTKVYIEVLAAAAVCPQLGSATGCCDRLLRGFSQDVTCLLVVTHVCGRKENISSTYFTSRG